MQHLVRMARECGHNIACLPAGFQHLLVVPQQARPWAGVGVQRQVAAQDDSLVRRGRSRQCLPQPRQLRIAGAAPKLHKAPRGSLQAVWAVLLLSSTRHPQDHLIPRDSCDSWSLKAAITATVGSEVYHIPSQMLFIACSAISAQKS